MIRNAILLKLYRGFDFLNRWMPCSCFVLWVESATLTGPTCLTKTSYCVEVLVHFCLISIIFSLKSPWVPWNVGSRQAWEFSLLVIRNRPIHRKRLKIAMITSSGGGGARRKQASDRYQFEFTSWVAHYFQFFLHGIKNSCQAAYCFSVTGWGKKLSLSTGNSLVLSRFEFNLRRTKTFLATSLTKWDNFLPHCFWVFNLPYFIYILHKKN